MARQRPPYSPEALYHITARCTNKEWFSIPLDQVWTIMSNYLFFLHHAFGCEIHSFVLMNNHFHLLMRSPHEELGVVMNYFMRETSRCIGFNAERINQVYGGPYHASVIVNDRQLENVYRYVYQNPMRAKIVETPEQYRYSSLQQKLGLSHGWIPLVPDALLFSNLESTLRGLAKPFEPEEADVIRTGLKKANFELTEARVRRLREAKRRGKKA